MALPTLTVGAAPHWRSGAGLTRMHYAHILALLPTIVGGALGHAILRAEDVGASFKPVNSLVQRGVLEMGLDSGVLWLFGTAGTVALGVGGAILAEYASQIAMRQPYRATDGHGALIGMLLAVMMPPTVPWWVLLTGVFAAIFIGKQVYGGIGGYPMHPAAVGWLVLLLSWPNHIYPVESASIAAAHPSVVLLTAVGGLGLIGLRLLRWEIPLAVLLGVLATSGLFKLAGLTEVGMFEQVVTGHVMLGAFFLAADPTCSPANKRAMWLYGLGTGFMIMLIRTFGIWPDAVPFAVLLMNAVYPLLDRIRPPVRQVVPR